MASPHPSPMASIARLSSLSNSTLSQLHERTRALSLSTTNTAPPSANRSIQRNLNTLAKGLTELEALALGRGPVGGTAAGVGVGDGAGLGVGLGPAARKEVAGLRRMWDRLVGMLEADEEGRRMLAVVTESYPAIASQPAAVQPASESRFPSTGLSRTAQTTTRRDEPYRDHPEDAYRDDVEPASSSSSSKKAAAAAAAAAAQDESDPPTPSLPADQIYAAQQQAMLAQDGELDALSTSLGRQRELGLRMNEELELQHDLLGDLESGVDGTELRLGRASRRLGRVAKSLKEQGSTWTILGLIVILVFLIAVLR